MEGVSALAFLFLALWVIAIGAFAFWVQNARPGPVYEKYPRHVTRAFAVPLWNSWRRQVDPADIGAIEDWRRRYVARYLALVGLPALIFIGYVVFWGLQLCGQTETLVERSQGRLEALKSQGAPRK